MKRVLITIISLTLAIIYSIPKLAFVLGIILTVYHQFASGIFILIFAYNISKFVEYRYRKYLEKYEKEL